ncbi:hypothetical protein [Neobacillus sp.]|uniref:hypothetical protein n=1 Tax=Neobacillus sp. TaxID=2675273 RepID=UPI00289C314D|nr:hypothetical protein [Neobacillus sp.]
MIKGQLYLEWLKNREKVITTFVIIVLLGIGLTMICYVSQLSSVSDLVRMYIYGWMMILPFLAVVPLFIMLERDLKDRHIWLYTEASLQQLLNVKGVFLFLVSTLLIVFLCTVGLICEVVVQNGSLLSLLMPYVTLSLITLFKVAVMQFLFLLIWTLFQAVTVYSPSLALFVMPVSYVMAILLYSNFYDVLQVGPVPIHISGIFIQREHGAMPLFSLDKLFTGEMIAGLLIIAVSTFVSARLFEKKVGI